MILGDHLVPGEPVAWVGLGLGCIPVFGFRLLLFLLLGEALPFLYLIVPKFYT